MSINKNTKIEITIGKFFALLGSLLTIIYLFYTFAIKPDIDQIKANHKTTMDKMEETNKIFNGYFMDINNSIGMLNGNVEGLKSRFSDLREMESDKEKSSGSF